MHPTSNKPLLSSKNSSTSLNGRIPTTTTGSSKLSNKNQKKKKHQTYDVNVTIDLVSLMQCTNLYKPFISRELETSKQITANRHFHSNQENHA